MIPDRTVRWRCLDPLCEWSAVTTITLAGEPPPRCICGSTAQKIEHAPVNYLDFLRGEPFCGNALVPTEQ
jgi:hypothetical protein